MDACNYRITEGGAYGWQCFGSNAYRLDSWNGEQDGYSISILFDTRTQEVYQVEAVDYRRERAYRLTNPIFKQLFEDEVRTRGIVDEAWERDDGTPVMYTDLEVEEDWLEKARAIAAEEDDYDTRVSIPIDFTDDELLMFMTMAHERDQTFNQFVEDALRYAIEKSKLEESC